MGCMYLYILLQKYRISVIIQNTVLCRRLFFVIFNRPPVEMPYPLPFPPLRLKKTGNAFE